MQAVQISNLGHACSEGPHGQQAADHALLGGHVVQHEALDVYCDHNQRQRDAHPPQHVACEDELRRQSSNLRSFDHSSVSIGRADLAQTYLCVL